MYRYVYGKIVGLKVIELADKDTYKEGIHLEIELGEDTINFFLAILAFRIIHCHL